MKYFFSFLVVLTLTFITPNRCISQNSLQGVLMDSSEEPVAFANVILLSAKDSTSVYKGVVSEEDGSFKFAEIEEKDYLLKVSFVGYKEQLQLIKKGVKTVDPIKMELATSDLDQVVVNARRPVITRQVDRITFNVENSTLSTGNSFEILKRTPGVIVSQGALLIKNKPATVYINDRKVYLNTEELQQLLEGFSAVNVKSVEVITNPPAKYDAEGGAILNIITSKNIAVGYKGGLNASFAYSEEPKYSFGTSQYYKTDWLNAFVNYNYNTRTDFKEDDGEIEFFNTDGSTDEFWFNNFKKETKTNSHSINTILDFTLNSNNSLSLSANILLTPKADSDIDGLTNISNPQGQMESYYTTDSELFEDRDNILLNANYTSKLNDKGASFSAIANAIFYDNETGQQLMTQYFEAPSTLSGENSFTTDAFQSTDIFTGQVDFSLPLSNMSLETGAKYSGIRSESGLSYYDTNNGASNYIDALSDIFDYNENIYAAYVSMNKDWEKWSLKVGLRGEMTNVDGSSKDLGNVNTQEYFELFPTTYLTYSPGDSHYFSLQYSRRIARPRFESLNPYRYFLNENNVKEGNPNLKPGISNRIQGSYTFKNKLTFDLYWERTNNSSAALAFQDNEAKVLRTVNDNLEMDQQYSLDISYYNYIKDWWYLSIYSSFFYMQADFVALESDNQIVTNDVVSTYMSVSNYFTLSKDGTFSGDLSLSYLPKYISGSYQFDEPQYNVSFGLRKSFYDGRLVATMNVEDLFNTQNIPLTSQYLNQNNTFFAKPESRMFRFGLRYNFGNFKLRDNNRAQNAEERTRL